MLICRCYPAAKLPQVRSQLVADTTGKRQPFFFGAVRAAGSSKSRCRVTLMPRQLAMEWEYIRQHEGGRNSDPTSETE